MRVWRPIRTRTALAAATFIAAAISVPANSGNAAADTSGPDPSQVTYFARQLGRNSVYVSDQMPRQLPRSAAPAIAETAKRLDAPVYVLALPGGTVRGTQEALLDAVHARLGRDGVYVLLDETSVGAARPYGVAHSAREVRDAAYAVTYELPSDASAQRGFRRFVEILDSGQAHQRYETARVEFDHASGREPDPLHPSPSERKNQSLLTGIAVAGVPVLLLTLIPYIRHWRRTLRVAGREDRA
ncbi:hypothetical protein [Streptomyces sp. NPDC051776]|uniref:hypothetical protein n=1 Tax=Streptomyces sp. NPDC051776 TaxID=3155414 RepID=UPI0034196F01